MIVYSVSEITSIIKEKITPIGWVWVQGEVSNLRPHSSGHIYFSLKDENSILKGVIFKNDARHLDYKLEEGRIFQVFGRIDIWEKASQYQIIGEKVLPGELGSFYLRFEEIKKKLEKKGFFEERFKREIPKFPEKVGIITSAEGAAIRDVLKIIKKRFPPITVIVRPTLVQGDGSSTDVINAIREFEEFGDVDLLIITRGGGSIEDLWAFNEEEVAEEIFNAKIPIISAIGHERDFSISDFVADQRAATPTEAGGLAVPSRDEITVNLNNLKRGLSRSIYQKMEFYKSSLGTIEKSYAIRRPLFTFEMKQQYLDHLQDLLTKSGRGRAQILQERLRNLTLKSPDLSTKFNQVSNLENRLENSINLLLKERKQKIKSLESTIQATSYEKTLQRGYSIVRKENEIIRDSQKLKRGDQLNIQFYQGSSKAIVEETEQ
ncbi:MAG: exodeoxyribonuclease VII large subunit [candidate division WOR-3 bacterium]|nr:exodeoxyribonuclease VII large subunit [candidate division WOR-3 bacterium]